MKRFSAALLASFIALTTVARPAMAFDWNGQTVGFEFDIGDVYTTSGHPLATHNAFRAAVKAGRANTTVAKSLLRVLRESKLDDLELNGTDSMQTVIFGSWLNEVNTNIDGEGSFALYIAARFLRLRYAAYLEGRSNSENWAPDTGYSSSNYMHSMMVSSTSPSHVISQNDGFDMVREFTHRKLAASIMELALATKGSEDGSIDASTANEIWISGLHSLGNVFHVIEDSSVACSTEASAELRKRGHSCVVGDGHGVIGLTRNRERRILSLSNNAFYDRKVAGGLSPHAELDGLYTAKLIPTVFGDFDPALVDGKILIAVVTGVVEVLDATRTMPLFNANGSPNSAFDTRAQSIAENAAIRIQADIIGKRYADVQDRKPLPPVPASGKADGVEVDVEEPMPAELEDEAGGCAVSAPSGKRGGGLSLLLLSAVAFVTGRRRRRAA